jgi:hypothetical protein
VAESAAPGAGPTAGEGAGEGAASPVWHRAPNTAYVETPERVVVLDLDHLGRAPYVFEGSAAQVWACVDGDRTEVEIVHDLAETFGVPSDVVAADVRRFVDRLADLGLITDR